MNKNIVRRRIDINLEKYQDSKSSLFPEMKELNIDLYIPPSDILFSVVSEYNGSKDIYALVFNYPNNESSETLHSENKIKLFVGKFSKRLQKIEISEFHRRNIKTIKLRNFVTKELELLDKKSPREIMNINAADEVIKENHRELFSEPKSESEPAYA